MRSYQVTCADHIMLLQWTEQFCGLMETFQLIKLLLKKPMTGVQRPDSSLLNLCLLLLNYPRICWQNPLLSSLLGICQTPTFNYIQNIHTNYLKSLSIRFWYDNTSTKMHWNEKMEISIQLYSKKIKSINK